ncbi:MAG TPA: hypothetical protein VEA18_01105 [Candidatus Kapabacteria bacterium]|nr:hypothetical protein [Candidatus Kapabacteria bacterium]
MKKQHVLADFDGVIPQSLHASHHIFRTIVPDLSLEAYRAWFDGNLY